MQQLFGVNLDRLESALTEAIRKQLSNTSGSVLINDKEIPYSINKEGKITITLYDEENECDCTYCVNIDSCMDIQFDQLIEGLVDIANSINTKLELISHDPICRTFQLKFEVDGICEYRNWRYINGYMELFCYTKWCKMVAIPAIMFGAMYTTYGQTP